MSSPRSRLHARRTQRRAGALDGFEAFVAESGDRLFRLAVVSSADVRSGEDLYQETLQRLATHWTEVDNPNAWCRRVMGNLVVDRARARKARVTEVPAVVDLAVADPGHAGRMDAAELRPALLDALGSLPDTQRMVVGLRYLEDRSEAEVAGLLDLPVGTVKSTASRAVSRLRRHPSLSHLLSGDAATG